MTTPSPTIEETVRLRVLSLGVGWQSSAMALMAARGEIGPMPDCAIFADTGGEKRATYRYLDWLEHQLPFPIYRVTRFPATLAEYTLHHFRTGEGSAFTPPFFSRDPDAMLPIRCSKEFKVRAVTAKIRELIGLEPGARGSRTSIVEQWIGMTTDEAHRMKPSETMWIDNRWPLVELGLKRYQCGLWFDRTGNPRPPKSACVYCPFQGEDELRDMRDNPADDDWSRAVAFDEAIRPGGIDTEGTLYLTKQRVPLVETDLSTAAERGQPDLFGNECEGMCGV